jgi:ferric-dicitrate binding protein FerR (iron transport regulator)
MLPRPAWAEPTPDETKRKGRSKEREKKKKFPFRSPIFMKFSISRKQVEKMDEQIMIWIADYCAGTLSGEEFRQLERWVEASPRHREEFKEYLRVHRAALELTLVDHLDRRESWQRLLERVAPGRARWRRRWRHARWAVAAAVVAGIFLLPRGGEEDRHAASAPPGSLKATLLFPEGGRVALERHVTLAMSGERLSARVDSVVVLEETHRPVASDLLLEVPRGGEYHLTLADGTGVWLNSDTRLRFPFPFAARAREVYLEGEAYFEVRRDEERPFIVRTGAGAVNVLGTSFNISAYPENSDMVTTLVEGSVEVAVAGSLTRLVPGQQAAWRRGEITVREVDVASCTSWIKGVFEFEDTSLREILTYLARWYNVSFEFAGEEVAGLRFTGGAKKYLPLEEFLTVIERSCEVKFSMKESVIHVSGNQ